ncbi:CarD family transcriptional regulator [Anaerocolumna sp.]|uniref:CarD family transcriptional regulator n=1 Tax=Anaerocolumna sp. TaxID=2041569 RepID=UPI0028AFABD7|nr:CarD family transcriptional regulator [Anaerocolumna sp.]
MFKQGDYIMYSNYGACFIDEIAEKTIADETKLFYIMRPVNEDKTRIMTPINNKKVKMRSVMSSEEAENIFNVIMNGNVNLITDRKQREKVYSKILKEGNPFEIAEIILTLLLEKDEKNKAGKNISVADKKYLEQAEKLLYSELSVSLDIEMDQVKEKVLDLLLENEVK